MGTMQWLAHFESSVERPRNIDWSRVPQIDEELREPLVRALAFFQRGLSSQGFNLRTKVRQHCPDEYVQCIDLYVQEKAIHADQLAKLVWALGGQPGRRSVADFAFRRFRRRFGWLAEIMVLLSVEMVTVPFFRVLANQIDDPLIRDVLEGIIYDQSWHIGFHIDHVRPELDTLSGMQNVAMQAGWASLFTSVLSVLLAECHPIFDALGYSRVSCWTDAWNLFAQVQTGLNGSGHLNALLGRDPRIRFAL